MVSAKFEITLPEKAESVLHALQTQNHQAFVVGGCVRDFLRGVEPHDWDICTDARPEQVIEIFGSDNTIPTGIKHGTVTVKMAGELFEVTTFRTDGKYMDGRHPENVTFIGNIEDDLERRDFTINAMAYNPSKGLIDPFGGEFDLTHGFIRAVGYPEKRFQEDPLRILRALRFEARMEGFSIDGETYTAMESTLDDLKKISAERIGSELLQIVCAPFAAKTLSSHKGIVIRHVIPELDTCYGVAQNNKYHHEDVFSHIISTLYNAQNSHEFPDAWSDQYVRMALLLHDIGKPSSKTTDENGYDHFYGHAKVSAEMAEKILRRLRYSNKFIDTVVELILNHDVEFVPTKPCARRHLNRLGEEQLHRLLKLRECDNRAHTPAAWLKFDKQTVPFSKVLQEVLDEESAFSLKDLAINGRDLIQAGYTPGPQMGHVLNTLCDEVINDKTQNTKAALLERAEQLYRGDGI